MLTKLKIRIKNWLIKVLGLDEEINYVDNRLEEINKEETLTPGLDIDKEEEEEDEIMFK